MEIVKVELEMHKDAKEVVDLLDGILEKVMAKAELSSYTELLDEFMAAVDGIQNVGEAVKSQYRDELVGYLVHKVMGRLLPIQKDEQPAQ